MELLDGLRELYSGQRGGLDMSDSLFVFLPSYLTNLRRH